MYIKIFGCMVIFCSCALIGYSFRLKQETHIYELENFRQCMQIFEKNIRYSMSDIMSATTSMLDTASIQNRRILQCFLNKSEHSDGHPLSEIWKQSIRKAGVDSCYDKDDLEVFAQFGNVLGSGDIETQTKNIDIFMMKLAEKIETLKQALDKSGNIFAKMGIYAGIMIIVLVI